MREVGWTVREAGVRSETGIGEIEGEVRGIERGETDREKWTG